MKATRIGPFVLDFNIMLMHSILSNSGLKWQSKCIYQRGESQGFTI